MICDIIIHIDVKNNKTTNIFLGKWKYFIAGIAVIDLFIILPI